MNFFYYHYIPRDRHLSTWSVNQSNSSLQQRQIRNHTWVYVERKQGSKIPKRDCKGRFKVSCQYTMMVWRRKRLSCSMNMIERLSEYIYGKWRYFSACHAWRTGDRGQGIWKLGSSWVNWLSDWLLMWMEKWSEMLTFVNISRQTPIHTLQLCKDMYNNTKLKFTLLYILSLRIILTIHKNHDKLMISLNNKKQYTLERKSGINTYMSTS